MGGVVPSHRQHAPATTVLACEIDFQLAVVLRRIQRLADVIGGLDQPVE